MAHCDVFDFFLCYTTLS